MNTQNYHEPLKAIIEIAKQAGEAIMEIYATNFDVTNKNDNSPLTQADLAANQVIVSAIKQLTPHIPILTEESEAVDSTVRRNWQQYWLIDPLDGTREFVKRNGEFTVNIALIDQHVPVLGVVYAPVTDLLYYASRGQGAYKQINGTETRIHTKNFDIERLVIAGSRSHSDKHFQQFLQNLHVATGVTPELISMGSSLKIGLVAEGVADVYPRLGPTSEWDTAAAHCVLQEAGGDIIDVDGHSLRYNTKESLLNPTFFATNKNTLNWASFL